MYVCISVFYFLLFKDTDISITITQDTLQKKTNYMYVSVVSEEHIMLFDLFISDLSIH
jgi:hypothetical protein